jgi:N-acetylglucosamine-6-sulfatase
MTPHPALAPLLVLATVVAGLLGAAPVGAGASAATVTPPAATELLPPSRPNIVLVTTDDQRLDDLLWMPRTRRLLGDQGVTFRNAVSAHPMCCPARTEILTGQMAHNSGVHHNFGPLGGFRAFAERHADNHLGVWLQDAGYRTAFLGKFINGYGDVHGDQPGWDVWSPTTAGTYSYRSYRMREYGESVAYSMEDEPAHYVTDLVARRAREQVSAYSRAEDPYFVWLSFVAPHTRALAGRRWGPPVPAPRHVQHFSTSTPPVVEQPHFKEKRRGDKPRAVRADASMDRFNLVRSHRQRIRSLRAVDEAVARMVAHLDRLGDLDDTLVVFVSDNGYLMGEHGITGKNWPYEASLRVPLLMRGPGFPAGVVRRQTTTLVDLPATFLSLAGVTRPGLDGQDLAPVVHDDVRVSHTSLIQAGAQQTEWRWRGVRTSRYTYVEWTSGDRELYDRREDPYQLQNRLRVHSGAVRHPRYARVLADLQRRFAALRDCRGPACRVGLGADTTPED